MNTGVVGSLPSVSGSIIAFGDFIGGVINRYDISTNEVIGTGIAGWSPSISDSIIAFYPQESVGVSPIEIKYYDLSSGEVVSTGVKVEPPPPAPVVPPDRPSRGFYALSVSGSIIAACIDGKGGLIAYYDIVSKVAATVGQGFEPSVSGSIVVFGDLIGGIIQYYDMSTNEVVSTGVVGMSPSIGDSIIAFQTSRDVGSKIGYIRIYKTIPEIAERIDNFREDGSIDNAGTAQGLKALLEQAQAMIDRGNISAAKNMLQAFINHALAQQGKHITTEAAQFLIESIQSTINSL